MKFILILLFSSFLGKFVCAQNDTITLVSYNLLNFPDGRNDCGAGNINPINRTDTLRRVLGYLKPDIFVACEIQTNAGADSILTRSLNVFGSTQYAIAPFQYSSGGGGELNNAMFYNTDKLVFLRQNAIPTVSRDINHYTLYAKDPNLSSHRDTIFIEVYMSHLKAGSATADQATRAQQTQVFRNYVDSKPLMRNHIICGDMNVYRSSEACYQNLTTGGTLPFIDPIFSPGNWNNNSSFAQIHTQSTRTSGGIACGSTGGLDDRFDQILVTSNVLSGTDRLNYVTNSYKAVGNDGLHYNSNLLSPAANAQYPDSVVTALYYMSDHLPVTIKMIPELPTSNGLALTYTNNGPLCAGDANGTATVTPLLGNPPYTYLWDINTGNQTSATATNLLPGSYCVNVTDNSGLTDVVCFEIASIPGISASVFPTSANIGCDAEATILVNGGTSPYTFLWDDPMGQTTQTATNLCPGNYTCTITDNGGCSAIVPITIYGTFGLMENLLAKNELILAPNPVSDVLHIINKSNQIVQADFVEILDFSGKSVLVLPRFEISVNSENNIDVSGLHEGIYFVKLKLGDDISFFKLVK